MKEYYIAINGNAIGPLTIDEVKTYAPKPDTLAWTAGMREWQPIRNIAELNERLFPLENGIQMPPALPSLVPPPLSPLSKDNSQRPTSSSNPHRDKVKIVAIVAACVLGVVAILTLADYAHDKSVRHDLEQQTIRAEQRQREMTEDEARRQAELARQEAERKRQEEAALRAKEQRVQWLKNRRTMLNNQLRECTARLEDAKSFHFLRTSFEREQQINAILKERNAYVSELANIDAELKSYEIMD